MYIVNKDTVVKQDATTFAEFGLIENDIEEMLRKNIDMICDEDESVLINGKQFKNAKHGVRILQQLITKGGDTPIAANGSTVLTIQGKGCIFS